MVKIMTDKEQRCRPVTPGAPRPVFRKCFICGTMNYSPDKEPPFRCGLCIGREALADIKSEE